MMSVSSCGGYGSLNLSGKLESLIIYTCLFGYTFNFVPPEGDSNPL